MQGCLTLTDSFCGLTKGVTHAVPPRFRWSEVECSDVLRIIIVPARSREAGFHARKRWLGRWWKPLTRWNLQLANTGKMVQRGFLRIKRA